MATNNPQAPKIVSVLLRVFGMLPLLGGLGLLAGGFFFGVHQYNIVKKWPTVDGEVARSELAKSQERIGSDAHLTTVYRALIDFRYTVGGKEYTTSVGSNYSSSSYAEMKRKVDAFAPGTHHPIRYNPAKPNDIRDDAGFTFGFFLGPLIFLGAGLMSASAGALLFLMGWAIGRAKVRCPSCGALAQGTGQHCTNCGAMLSPAPSGQ